MALFFGSAYSDKGLNFEVNSAVISASTDPKPPTKLNDPVIIASSNLQEMAVSWRKEIKNHIQYIFLYFISHIYYLSVIFYIFMHV